ncbi:septation protein SepH [Rathayibacter toxicus]|uniref:septation protein SepH n=1 Tax=Rathayibacter toxicus TaxID=145458 RepID=UPI001E34925E|nr:septation protein SepH [Rathayibacter toxicus]
MMKELKVIGVEGGSLILVSDAGVRFCVHVDETLRNQLRPRLHYVAPRGKRVSPREIQAHIRSGLSADDVAELTGAPLEYIARFEGPVIAEREHIVASALAVRVHTSTDPDPLEEGIPFGDVIGERLTSLGAEREQWSSWKEDEGWVVKLLFRSDEIDHDARWRFDPKKAVLSPLTSEAVTLSQQGEIRPTLIPRLRAVVSAKVDERATRFDPDVFSTPTSKTLGDSPADNPVTDTPEAAPLAPSLAARPSDTEPQPTLEETPRLLPSVPRSATNTTEKREHTLNDTADLLDALRRRRGEREHSAPSRVREDLQEAPISEPEVRSAPPAPAHPSGARASLRRGRASMPSWDEIVFGARTEE